MNLGRLPIFSQFVILGTVAFIVIGSLLSSLVAPALTNFTLEQQELNSVVFANRLAAEFLLPEDFRIPPGPQSRQHFEKFVNNLQVPGLFRVKIWNSEGVIVYSDKEELIGKQFPLNEGLRQALELDTTVELETFDPNDPHYYYELSFGEGIETYAPITFGASSEVVGVLETYARSGFLKQQINRVRNMFVLRIVLSLAILFGTLSLIVWRASRNLEAAQAKLREYATGLEYMVAERTRRLEEATTERIRQTEELSRLKDEFVSLASHQLRTPPSVVNWYAEMLLSGEVGKINKQQKEYLEEIYRANQGMVKLVNDFLNVSRIELGTLVIEPQKIDLVSLVEGVFSELAPQIRERKIAVKKQHDKNLPALHADPGLTRIVFQNLLSNAVKYTPPGGRVSINIHKSSESYVLIKVSDTGYGIPQKDQPKVFTKLFRADNVREKEAEGTGLGLYFVRSVVEQCGGKIWFSSPGELTTKNPETPGTTFSVLLPIQAQPSPRKEAKS